MKYYAAITTRIPGKAMVNATRVVGPHSHQKASKLVKAFAAEQGEYKTFDDNGYLTSVSGWQLVSEKKMAEMRGEQ